MKFNYRKTDLSHPFKTNKQLLRPIIALSIGSRNSSVRFEALLDSGSDFNIFPKELADKLGINLKDKEQVQFSGIESDLNAGLVANVILEIGNVVIPTKVVFSEATEATGILGQYGFFDKFIVKFDLIKKEVELKPRRG